MANLPLYEEIHSALLVDFDDIYAKLNALNQDLANIFASQPQKWLKWIEGHALRKMYGENIRRRFLKKVCFANTPCFADHLQHFIRAGFQIAGQTSSSYTEKFSLPMLMAVECFDLLQRNINYDEFIFFSGQIDLAPSLLKLQEHAKRTLFLAIGPSPIVLSAAASWKIREDWFISQALEDSPAEEEMQYKNTFYTQNESYDSFQIKNRRSENKDLEKYENTNPQSKIGDLIHFLETIVKESSKPMSLPTIAQELQQKFCLLSEVLGDKTLKETLRNIKFPSIVFTEEDPGYLYHPLRHKTLKKAKSFMESYTV